VTLVVEERDDKKQRISDGDDENDVFLYDSIRAKPWHTSLLSHFCVT
jgi:hypothetical protein